MELITQLLEYGKIIWMYGSYIFIFWVGVKLVNFVLGLIKGKLSTLSETTLASIALSKEIVVIIKDTNEDLHKHREESRAANKKVTQMIKNTLELSNGSNPIIRSALDRIDALEKK